MIPTEAREETAAQLQRRIDAAARRLREMWQHHPYCEQGGFEAVLRILEGDPPKEEA